MATETKVLVGTIHLPADEDSPDGHIYHDGDTPSPEHAKLITNPNAWRVVTGDDESDLMANADENMKFLLREAKKHGIEPGHGLPRTPSRELLARAVAIAQDPTRENIDVGAEAEALDGRTKAGRAAKASTSAAGS